RRTYNGVHLNKKSNTQDVVEQSLTIQQPDLQIWSWIKICMKKFSECRISILISMCPCGAGNITKENKNFGLLLL
ncbi:hypothetical protein AAH003_20565, partial [Bacteroides uniformis]